MWTLGNGEECHAANPTEFEIPNKVDRESCQPGDFVKLIFLAENSEIGDMMWVHITQNVNGSYIGILDFYPIFEGLKFGDLVAFKPENIIDILPSD